MWSFFLDFLYWLENETSAAILVHEVNCMCVSVYSRIWVSSTKHCYICLRSLTFRLLLMAYLAAIILYFYLFSHLFNPTVYSKSTGQYNDVIPNPGTHAGPFYVSLKYTNSWTMGLKPQDLRPEHYLTLGGLFQERHKDSLCRCLTAESWAPVSPQARNSVEF